MLVFHIFWFLNFTSTTAYKELIKVVKDKILSNCVTEVIQDWGSKKIQIDVNLMKVDDDIKISEMYKIPGLRFITGDYIWSIDYSNIIIIIEAKNHGDIIEKVSKVATDELWNPQRRFLIILQNIEDRDMLYFTKVFLHYNMFDIILICYQHGDYSIYKFHRPSNSICSRPDNLVLLSTCSRYLTTKNFSVQETSKNLRDCRFKFITRITWPYTHSDPNMKLGIDQRILKLYEKYEGTQIKQHPTSAITDKYGRVKLNHVKGILKRVEDNEFDGAVGGLILLLNRTKGLSFTYPVIINSKVIILAHAADLGPWTGVLKQLLFGSLVIGFVFAILCVTVNVITVFPSMERDVTRNILLVLGYILNKTNVVNIHQRLPHRVVFLCLLWLALLLTNIIQGYLYGSITHPIRGYEPKDLNEIIGYTPMIFSEFPNKGDFNGIDCETSLNCLLEVKNNPTKLLYTIVSHVYYTAFASTLQDDQCNLNVYNLKESYGTELQTIYLPSGSILRDRFSNFALRLASAGFIVKYYDDIQHFEKMQCKFHDSELHKSLLLRDVYVYFLILIFGYTMSLLTFIGELIFGGWNLR